MKNVITIIVCALLLLGAYVASRFWWTHTADPKIAKFNESADNLLLSIQQYKEFVGSYPTGNNIEIAKALTGQTEKKVVILTVRKSEMNAKGEIIDPWGTPLQFYFSANGILIRSAGPNGVFEDSKVPTSDDLYRSN